MRELGILALVALAGCSGLRRPSHAVAPVGSSTLEIGGGSGVALRGVAGDGALTFAATAVDGRSSVHARRDRATVWNTPLAGLVGPITRTSSAVVATLGGSSTIAGLAVRGAPAGAVVALDPATGAPRWKLAVDSSEWAVITCIAPAGADVLVGGSFSGTLRVAAKVVSSAGKTDGFVARVTATGEVAWLIRTGGAGADAVQGIATSGARIAITGTFSAGAELLGEPFTAVNERSPYADAFVVELDAGGTRVWSASFGGNLEDAVAGVAIDGKGRVAVAATVRDTARVGGTNVVVQGPADGVVAFWSADGSFGPAVVLGGTEFDGVRAIVASGDHVVVGGFFSGTLVLGRDRLDAATGDDAYLVALDGPTIIRSWPIAGAGREEIVALSAVPSGFIAGVAHTASARIDGVSVAAPRDPLAGAALVVRAVR